VLALILRPRALGGGVRTHNDRRKVIKCDVRLVKTGAHLAWAPDAWGRGRNPAAAPPPRHRLAQIMQAETFMQAPSAKRSPPATHLMWSRKVRRLCVCADTFDKGTASA
jgi:hypothetical protein